MVNELTLWIPKDEQILPAKAKKPAQIVPYALQLSIRDRNQIVKGFKAGNYEMVVNFVWIKAMASLKKELSTVGMGFLGEMLGRPDLSEDDDVVDSITDREAIRLAEELGVISSTEALRLRQSQELVAHFSKLDASLIDEEGIELDELEALSTLKVCVKNILGKPKVEVATEFVKFRKALVSRTLGSNNSMIQNLDASPYFFHRLTISILLSAIYENVGAKLEHALANMNLILPLVWERLRDTEKWQVGRTYAEVHSEGKTTAMGGLRKALLKVKGFDFVPESLRSTTFIDAAEKVIKAHEGFDNYYLELAPIKVLKKLGTVIPTPAFPICASAILAVFLGNSYGKSWSASPIAKGLLLKFTSDRWEYYLNECLPGDIRILDKLLDESPRNEWFNLVTENQFLNLNIKNRYVRNLISFSENKNHEKVKNNARILRKRYYGKK
jgi:hypothetical protein